MADGFSVPDELVFSDTVSGAKDEEDRPAFGALMEAGRTGKYEGLYFWSLDRMSRDLIVGVRALNELDDLGIKVFSITEPGVVENRVVRNLLLTLSEEERRKIVARTKGGKRIKRLRGQFVSGTIPFGYKRADGQTLTPCPDEAPVLRRLYDDVIAGDGRITIARRLNREGVPPPFAWVKVPDRNKVVRLRMNEVGGWAGLNDWLEANEATLVRPPRWSEGTISKLIVKTVNYGVLDADEDVGLDAVRLTIAPAPVISESTYRKALTATAGRFMKGSAPPQPKLLTGLLRCGNPDCGRAMIYHQAGAKRNDQPSQHRYLCSGRRSGSGCGCASVPMGDADQLVLERVIGYLTSRLSGRNFHEFLTAHDRQQVEVLAARLATVERERDAKELERKALLDTVHRLTASGLDDGDLGDLPARIRALRSPIDKLTAEAEALYADIGRSTATLAANDDEAREAARLAEDVVASLSPPGSAEDDPLGLLPDARLVLRRIVRQVTVRDVPGSVQKRLVVDLDESDEALVDVVRAIGEHALATHRRIEALGEGAAKPEVDLGDLEQKVQAFVSTSRTSG